MNMPQIQIQTTDIKMQYSITNAQVAIQQPNATLQIEQPAAILDIKTTNGQLQIDSSQARRDLGLIGPFESVKNYAQMGKQKAMAGAARRAREGNQLMESAGKGQGAEPIKNIAKQNHGPKRAGPINIKFVPSIGSVKTNYTPGKVDVNIQAQAPRINAQVNKPNIQYTAGDVSATMMQRPDVSIDVLQ